MVSYFWCSDQLVVAECVCNSIISDLFLQNQLGGLINAILYLGAAAGALLVGRPFMVNSGSLSTFYVCLVDSRLVRKYTWHELDRAVSLQGARIQLLISDAWARSGNTFT